MKSEAMLLSLEWRLSRGRFLIPKLLGYDKVIVEEASGIKRSKLVINESQAQTVKLMYYMLLSGCGLSEIADTLTELVRETGGKRKDKTPNTQWTPHGITAVMRATRSSIGIPGIALVSCGKIVFSRSLTRSGSVLVLAKVLPKTSFSRASTCLVNPGEADPDPPTEPPPACASSSASSEPP